MSLFFKQNAYLECITDYDSGAFFDHLQKNVKYTYKSVDFQNYTNTYNSKGWGGRKVIAIPAAIATGIVKTTYHFGKLIVLGLIKLDKKNVKIYSYRIGRDLQEACGWLITLFNDKRGRFQIEESRFHQKCYDIVLTDSEQKLDKQSANLNFASSPQKIYNQARRYIYKGCLDKAVKELNKIPNTPSYPIVKFKFMFKIAQLHFANGNNEMAIKLIKNLNTASINLPADLSDNFYLFNIEVTKSSDYLNKIDIFAQIAENLFYSTTNRTDADQLLTIKMKANSDLHEFITDFFKERIMDFLFKDEDPSRTLGSLKETVEERSFFASFKDIDLISPSEDAWNSAVLPTNAAKPRLFALRKQYTSAYKCLGVNVSYAKDVMTMMYDVKKSELDRDNKMDNETDAEFTARHQHQVTQVEEAYKFLCSNKLYSQKEREAAYETLGVESNAASFQIRRAYFEKVLLHRKLVQRKDELDRSFEVRKKVAEREFEKFHVAYLVPI